MNKLFGKDNKKKIYFIRHPKTVVGQSVCYGITDYDVAADVMHETATKVSAKLADINFDCCYSSPLQRCTKLAKRLFPDKDITLSKSISEINFGSWEALAWEDIPFEELDQWGKDLVNYKKHGGESLTDVQKRLLPFWENLIALNASNIAVVAHKGVIVTLLSHILEANPIRMFMLDIDFGSIVEITVKGNNFFSIKIGI